MFRRGERSTRSTRSTPWQTLAVAALVAAALFLCAVALTREAEPQTRALDEAGDTNPGIGASDDPTADPSGDGSDGSDGESGDDPTGTATADETDAPRPPSVKDLRRRDFTTNPQLPDGARTFDNESVGSALAVEDGVLQHGLPRGPVAVSSLEVDLGADVQKLGVRVRFSGEDPGSVVLAAWQDSFITSREDAQPVPQSGLRLVATAGSWELTASPAEDVVASGEFTEVDGTATFEVYRSGQQAWVVDPSGATTLVEDSRIERLAGPFACWQLVERETAMTPAVIESVWAG